MEFTNNFGTFTYEKINNTISITGYQGSAQYICIPETIDGCNVTTIAAKAFLSKKQIEKLILSPFTDTIGDWAFAHMTGLKMLIIPANDIFMGKQIFMDCPLLTQIALLPTSSSSNETATLQDSNDNQYQTIDHYLPFYIACTIQVLKDALLFTPASIGSASWYHGFDQSVLRLLERPDDDGFEPVFYGWFEVEDISVTQLPAYIKKRRLEKASLSLKRLLNPCYLNTDVQSKYEEYVCKHMLTGIWDYVISDENVQDVSYLKLLLQLGCITEANINNCLQDLVSKNAKEASAILLHYKETQLEKKDFFSDLKL